MLPSGREERVDVLSKRYSTAALTAVVACDAQATKDQNEARSSRARWNLIGGVMQASALTMSIDA